MILIYRITTVKSKFSFFKGKNKYYYNIKGQFHREGNLPAIETWSGARSLFLNDRYYKGYEYSYLLYSQDSTNIEM